MFIKACAYLGVCNGSGVRLFLYHSDKELGYHNFLDWGKEVPFIQAYLDCFTDYPVLHPSHPWFADKVRSLSGHLVLCKPKDPSASRCAQCKLSVGARMSGFWHSCPALLTALRPRAELLQVHMT